MTVLFWFLVGVLALVFIYLAFRFGSAAIYRSRKEYHDWIHRKGEDNAK